MIPGDPNNGMNDVLLNRLESLSSEQRANLRRSVLASKLNGNSLLAETLYRCGTRRVLGITGTPVDQIFSECWARAIRPIGTRHQHAAVLMAAASNYICGRLESVVVVSAGPAVTNAVTGVLVAYNNGWPVIVFGGRRPVHEEGIGYFQELDAVPIFQSVTKWAAKVERAADIAMTVTRAFEVACSGRPGPVYLDLPEDVLLDHAVVDNLEAPNIEAPLKADTKTVAVCARELSEAEHPLLIIGEGIRWSFSETDLRHLVEQTSVPFITTPMARGFLPDDHPLCANLVRRWIQSQADVVLMCGASFDWRFRFGGELAPDARVIHVDIDAATLGKNVAGALNVHADSGLFISQLHEALAQHPVFAIAARREPWRRQVNAACEEKRHEYSRWLAKETTPMSPTQLFAELRAFLSAEAIVILDGSVTLAFGQALLSAERPCSWLDPGWNGCMGVGIPLGMGAKLAEPNRMVIVVSGDFGFGLTAMDLETAVRHRIPIIVVVMNNDGITGALRQKSQLPREYGELFSRFQPGLRYERIMEVFGGHAEFVTEAAEIRPALERAAASGLASCINVRVDPEAPHPGFW